MAKALLIDPDKCTACRACELACSFKHSGEFNPARSRIWEFIFGDQAVYFPFTCTQCRDAWCARVCPAKAISRDEALGAWLVDEAKCVGCFMCQMACPFGVILVSTFSQKAEKCDLCQGDPECVRFCAPGAIEYVEVTDTVLYKRREFAQQLLKLIAPA